MVKVQEEVFALEKVRANWADSANLIMEAPVI